MCVGVEKMESFDDAASFFSGRLSCRFCRLPFASDMAQD